MSSLDQQTLDAIAEEFSREYRDGKQPSIEVYLAKHPDPSGELKTLLSSIAMIEGLKSSGESPSSIQSQIEQLDDYKIVREIGRGGMGIVFEAIHQSLGRRVAVKVLASSLLDQPKHQARFRREARAAARLRHSNIVPVFGVGQTNDQHYYVMDYIRGMSLREWLQSIATGDRPLAPTRADTTSQTSGRIEHDTFTVRSDETTPFNNVSTSECGLDASIPTNINSPEYFRWVAQLGSSICSALGYAHEQGVLHRDIKPANLMLAHDGNIWITDFGLAKLAEQDVTLSGDVVGTPQYMAPESFENEYDAASETYCVGLTLFELLTQRPAIDGKSTSDTIRKATQGVSASPRKINESIPKDLETIVLKTLSVDRQNRYATANELRDDLDRFLADRPISARRTGPVERLYRWSRREPAIASLTLGIFASLITLVVVAGAAYWKTNSALSESRLAKNDAISSAKLAEDQQRLAQSNLQVAIRAFDEVSQRIVERGSDPDVELLGEIADTNSPNVTAEDAEILQSLLTFFDELARNNSDNEPLKLQTAAARKRAGDIYSQLGKLSDADRSYRDSLAIYRDVAHENDAWELIVTQAELLNDRALIAGLRGRVNDAIDLHERTTKLLQASKDAIESPDGRFEYARANTLFTQIASRSGLDFTSKRKPLIRYFQPGQVRKPTGPKPLEEMVASNEAIDALTSLVDEFPENRIYQVSLARAYRDRVNTALSLLRVKFDRGGRFAEQSRKVLALAAESDLQESIERLQELHDQDPKSASIKYELAKSLSIVLPGWLSSEQRADRRDRLMRSRQLCGELLEDAPDAPRYLALEAQTIGHLAMYRRSQGHRDSAQKLLEDQLERQRRILTVSPNLSQYQIKLARTVELLAEIHHEKGNTDVAIRYLRQVLNRLRRNADGPLVRGKVSQLSRKLSELENGG